MSATPFPPDFSVVVPFFNEEAVAFQVVDELCVELEKLELSWEAILVDDGSRDGTGAELRRAHSRWPQCALLTLPHNLGQGEALFFGIHKSTSPMIGMMDGDGQNVPADFSVLLAALKNADLVNGLRMPRHDSWLRRRMSRLANAVRRPLLRDGVSDPGCALKVFRREVVASFLPVHMLNPFMPACAASAGWRVRECPVRHRPRQGGVSKYGFRVLLWRPFFDLLAISWILRRRMPRAPGRGDARDLMPDRPNGHTER